MKQKNLFACILAVTVMLPTVGAFGQQTIKIVDNFNFPAGGVSTLPQKINDNGDVAGVIDSLITGARRGFVRFHNGSFTRPIVDPNDTGGFTDLRGINNSDTVDGAYVGADGLFHGFIANGNSFTDYDVPDSAGTILLANNNNGDFCGGYATSANPNNTAFLNIGGTVTTVIVPDASISFCYTMNDNNDSAGQYTDVNTGVTHAFSRAADGTIIAPDDPPNSTSAIIFGINNAGFQVGRYTSATDGIERGFVRSPSGAVLTLDKTDATLTSLNGINSTNLMCGRWVDVNGVAHGIVAKITR